MHNEYLISHQPAPKSHFKTFSSFFNGPRPIRTPPVSQLQTRANRRSFRGSAIHTFPTRARSLRLSHPLFLLLLLLQPHSLLIPLLLFLPHTTVITHTVQILDLDAGERVVVVMTTSFGYLVPYMAAGVEDHNAGAAGFAHC